MENDDIDNELLIKVRDFAKKIPVIGDIIDKKPKVTVLRLAGVIADSTMKRNGISYNKFSKLIDKAFDKGDTVALVINSPGGSAAQSALIANHIRQRAIEDEKPVYSFIEDLAASGGYWLACAGDEIYAQESSIVGSIGVIAAGFGFEDFIEKHDIHRRVHTAGKDKSFMDPFLAEKPGDLKRLKAVQDDIHESFKTWVRERRPHLKGEDKDLFEGQFWTGLKGYDLGLIDDLGDVRFVMREKYGDNVKFIDLTPDKKLTAMVPGLKFETSSIADDILDSLENRAFWSRYGL